MAKRIGRRNRKVSYAVARVPAAVEVLESRRLLSVPPVANDDAYPMDGDGRIMNPDITTMPFLPARQEVRPAETDRIINVVGIGMSELGPLRLGVDGKHGEINVLQGGTLEEGGDVTIGAQGGHATVTISGGSTFINGSWFAAGFMEGFALISLRGAGSKWNNAGSFAVGFGSEGRARMFVEDGATLNTNSWSTIGGDYGGHGRVMLQGEGTTWNSAQWITVGRGPEGGVLYVGKGATVNSGGAVMNGPQGLIAGEGVIDANVQNSGEIDPGASPGVLTIDGELVQLPNGFLSIDVQGLTRGTGYDGLDVTGAVTLDGTLNVNFTRAPKAGDTFELIRAGSISGQFARVNVHGLLAGFQYKLELHDGGLRLVALNDGIPRDATVDRVPWLGFGVLRNDTDADFDRLSAVLVEPPKHGRVMLDHYGSFIYDAGPTYAGEDSFKYMADDGIVVSNVATVVISGQIVQPEAPVARADAYETTEDKALEVGKDAGVLANDTGAAVAVLTQATPNGFVRLNADGSFRYTPRANFNGTDTFTYRARSAAGVLSEPAVVTITVQGVNDAPIARADFKSTTQGVMLRIPASELLHNDSDPEGDDLRVDAVERLATTRGTIGFNAAEGVVTYTTPAGFVGTDQFRYWVADEHGALSSAVVSVNVMRTERPQLTGRATGYGSLNDRKQFLFFNVQGYRVGDALSARGHLAFFDTAEQIAFVGTAIETFSMPQNIHGSSAIFTGRGMLNGREGYRFEVTVQDFGGSGGLRDTFSIRIIDTITPVPEGVTVYQLTGTLDEFGNIAIRHAPPQRGAGGVSIVRGLDGSAVRRR